MRGISSTELAKNSVQDLQSRLENQSRKTAQKLQTDARSPACEKPFVNARQIASFTRGNLLKYRAVEDAKPIIDICHSRRPVSFIVTNNLAILCFYIARIVFAVIFINRHQTAHS